MMRSMIFTAPGELDMKEEAVPVPAEGQVLVHNKLSIISPGTELALFSGTHTGFNDPEIKWARYPLRPGYEAVGPREDTGELIMYYGPHRAESALFGRFAQLFQIDHNVIIADITTFAYS